MTYKDGNLITLKKTKIIYELLSTDMHS